MAESSLMAEPAAPRRGIFFILGVMGALVILYTLNGGSFLPALAIIGAGAALAIYFGAAYTRLHRDWLIMPLAMTAVFVNAVFLEGAPRAAIHYGLVLLFCLPCVSAVWRSGILRRGGFELYVIYFAWGLATLTYSLAPAYSIARLTDAVLVFCAVTAIVMNVKNQDDLTRLVERFILGCGVFVAVLAVTAVVLPRSMTWVAPDASTLNQSVARFRGLLNNPNDVGGLMLITVGPTLAFWSRFKGRMRSLLGTIALAAVAEAALADSRTPFVALAAGGVLYVLWRYRLRGILLMAGLAMLLVAALPLIGKNINDYLGRGDVTTLTGRTEMWAYVVQQIKRRPFVGYGYEVAGSIFKSRYFPIWYGPWDEGAQSSLHNGYLNHAVGVGIPATLFWLFIVLRPWLFVMRSKEDPWNLKPLVPLVIVPCLIHNLSEASIGDFLGVVGLLFGFMWVIGERYRLFVFEHAEAERQQALEELPSAIAVFRSIKPHAYS